ncbi:uncharacterized protein Z519_06068 [Cladophialophora bantiana CBS 173.52]|uniref:Glucose-methanol-choline oxidoreductase N-terminal domain-containing protein n=1 Tax=Cladophialophora bantiana (strain ATCC 10958 / CBS 173.52 / CDC B-1940 / NIH 8579) TaxID=1442370 RepID=A0A0D2HJL3_CLAB1|nr:uncharacterized protein Z519_06068 [Cladophialophora bantiana CBS 173.52]KIW93463.1 hypothetical protein Z519_06068 [Cladophialophora bantiana CBS 173.52]
MGSLMPEKFDFIVVGAGAAGAILAARLANSKQRPSVLLVEAGGKNDSKDVRADADRWLHRMVPSMNWGYKTAPVKGFDGNIVDYDRGKGLGGSTAINFSVWTLGPRDDYDEVARLVDDEEWSWNNVQKRYKRLESYHATAPDVPDDAKRYLDPSPKDHGYDGPIKVGFPKVWEPSSKTLMDIWYANGTKPNPDHNSGDPIGLAACISTAYKGVRSTSADALVGAPSNLHILVDTEVAQVTFDGTKATGIKTIEGRLIQADKEVILSGGALDTPRILMHSGIGPVDELSSFNIPIVQANENVGRHLKDHHHVTIPALRAHHTTERTRFYKSKELQAAARAAWEKDGSGPLSEYACTLGIGYLKLESLYDTPEFQALPKEDQDHLRKPTVPHYEIILNGPWLPNFLDPENAQAGTNVFVFALNQKSTGSVRLQSSDPKQPLIFDPNFFSHHFDKRVAVEATRDVLKVMKSPEFQNDTLAIDGPKSESEDDILAFWRANSASTWHMMGTARMGKDEGSAVVDKNFKVFGVENLRVADMSIIPIVSNNHTQTTAYLTGLTAADKLAREYGLDG